jgi:RimJ/RimL family protein N-acetyltransferase
MQLRSERLILRPGSASDAVAVTDACQDPEISRFIPLVPFPYSLDDAVTFLRHVEQQWADEDEERTFAIEDQKTGAFLGFVTVRLRDGGTVGFWLRRESRGQGFMTEAVQRVIDWAGEYDVRRLFLTAHPENLASQRVAEKVGFRHVGVAKHQPTFQDGTEEARLYELDLA